MSRLVVETVVQLAHRARVAALPPVVQVTDVERSEPERLDKRLALGVHGNLGRPLERSFEQPVPHLRRSRRHIVRHRSRPLCKITEIEPLFGKGEPVALSIGFYVDSAPTEPPDLDKLSRAVGDALTVCRVFADDAQVVALHAYKESASPEYPAGAFIAVSPAEPVPTSSAGLQVARVARLYRPMPRGWVR